MGEQEPRQSAADVEPESLDLARARRRIVDLERRLAFYERNEHELEDVAHRIMRSHDETEACRILARFAERMTIAQRDESLAWAESCWSQIHHHAMNSGMMRSEREVGKSRGLHEAANILRGAIELEKARRAH